MYWHGAIFVGNFNLSSIYNCNNFTPNKNFKDEFCKVVVGACLTSLNIGQLSMLKMSEMLEIVAQKYLQLFFPLTSTSRIEIYGTAFICHC
jgi:hypothetical protein